MAFGGAVEVANVKVVAIMGEGEGAEEGERVCPTGSLLQPSECE